MTEVLLVSDANKLIAQMANRHNVDQVLISAIVSIESNYNTFATQFEPKTYSKEKFDNPAKYARLNLITEITERIHQCTSWGLGQVLGMTARSFGYFGTLPMLCIPEINLDITTKILSKLLTKYKDMSLVIASYNSGSPIHDLKTGALLNQAYVTRVLTKYGELKSKDMLS